MRDESLESSAPVSRALERRVKRHVISPEHDFFAVVQPGFEKTLSEELVSLGLMVTGIDEGGVLFKSQLAGCYTANLCSRGASRVLMRIKVFRAPNVQSLYEKSSSVPWELYLSGRPSFSIKCRKSALIHTGLVEETVLSAMRDREEFAAFYENHIPDQTVYIRMNSDECTISIDSSGEPLYRRGIKLNTGRAPLRETLASLILLEARCGEYSAVLDPMCGTGTFGIEAAGLLSAQPAGMRRAFAFESWPAFRFAAFNHIKKGLIAVPEERKSYKILMSDIDPDAVNTASENTKRLGLPVEVTVSDFFETGSGLNSPDTLLVINPPYGGRIKTGDIAGFYRRISAKIKNSFDVSGFALIVPEDVQPGKLDLPFDRIIAFRNGGLNVSVLIKFSSKICR